MYVPEAFKEDRLAVLHDAIRRHSFATLVTSVGDEPEASHVPMFLESEVGPFGTLFGHLARANPHWRQAQAGGRALAIFLGPHAYVSPTWYETKRTTGEVVPTWNYLAVHARGTITFYDDPAELRAHVRKLTDMHEAARAERWTVDEAPEAYIDRMLRGIIGFRLAIATLEGKWKMSQNRSEQDVDGVRQALVGDGAETDKAVAAIMAERKARPRR